MTSLVYRDWVIIYDVKDGCVVGDPEDRWSTSKLNKNELMLLIGLVVQSTSDRTYTVMASADGHFADRADSLLREFHDRLVIDARPAFDPVTKVFSDGPTSTGLVGREAMYYGADSFFLHQFMRFCRHRYREDSTWLLQNVGISIGPMTDIARYIVDRVNDQMSNLGHHRKAGQEFTNGDLTNSQLIAKSDVRAKFGAKADAFFAKFVTPVTGSNVGFTHPFAINTVNIAPFLALASSFTCQINTGCTKPSTKARFTG